MDGQADGQQAVQQLNAQFQHIKKNGGRWLDKRVRYYIARLFAFDPKPIDMNAFMQINQQLKEQTGLFSTLSKEMREMLAGILLANHKEKAADINQLVADYKFLVEQKFGRSTFTYAGACLMQLFPEQDREQIVSRARLIYQNLKTEHPFLTGKEYNSIVLGLASQPSLKDQSVAEIGEKMEFYYRALREIGFKMHDSTLFAAAACVSLLGVADKQFISELKTLCLELLNARIKIRPMNYTAIAILAFVQRETNFSSEMELIPYLTTVTNGIEFVFEKEFKLALALSMFLEEQSQSIAASDLNNLSLSLQLVLIEEQVAYSAAATAVIVSTTNSNN